MKKIVYLLAAALSFATISCNPTVDPNAKEECIVKIVASGINNSGLNDDGAADGPEGLLGVQIYAVDGDVETPCANGLFSDWGSLQFKGSTNTTYRVVATMVVDAESVLSFDGEIYGRPFETAAGDEFVYGQTELVALSKSTAQLADGTMYVTPNVDRYYGESSKLVTSSDRSIKAPMKRVSFGVKATGELADGEQIAIKIAGAPEVELAKDEVEIFTLQYIKEAYAADESADVYSENINTDVLRSGASIFSDNIVYKRNKVSVLTVSKLGASFGFEFETPFEDGLPVIPDEDPTAFITKVFDYVPAPGQYVNTMPQYEEGDTQESMNKKVLDLIGDNKRGMITLGGYGGYVTVGFNHTIENREGKLDFRVLGNPSYNDNSFDPDNMPGGNCEPGVIMVAVDANKNGLPDDEWYEIQGSTHKDHTKELWYNRAVESGNNVNFYYNDYTVTYSKPDPSFDEDTPTIAWKSYIPWSDNKDNSGYIAKNTFHMQTYYPQWIDSSSLTFSGTILPQNGIDESQDGSNFVLYKFKYGYADNALDDEMQSAIDISWAVDADGNPANLAGVDFIKIYTGVMQVNGKLGECSTEVMGVTDLHVSGEDIDSFITE